MKTRWILCMLMLMAFTGCSSFSMLLSGGSIAVSQNSYAKMYNAADMLTIMSTEESIKKHAYNNMKKAMRNKTLKKKGSIST